MALTKTDATNFVKWLLSRGRDQTTANLYLFHVTKCFEEDPNDIQVRLLRSDFSPYTRRTILASLKAWAKWKKEASLLSSLEDIKLPPLRRKNERIPLPKEEWKRLIAIVTEDSPDAISAVIGMMATRGFRIGDVLLMRRVELQKALRTEVVTFVGKGKKESSFGLADQFRWCLDTLVAYPKWGQVYELITGKDEPGEVGRLNAAKMAIRRRLKKYAQLAGITDNIYPHRLRRTVATYFLEKANGDIVKLKNWMNWSNLATAALYVDYADMEELDAVASEMFEDDE